MKNVFKDEDYWYTVKWICKFLLTIAVAIAVAFIGIVVTTKISNCLALEKITDPGVGIVVDTAICVIGIFFSVSLSVIIGYTVACWLGLDE